MSCRLEISDMRIFTCATSNVRASGSAFRDSNTYDYRPNGYRLHVGEQRGTRAEEALIRVGCNAPRTSAAECWTKPMVRALESRKVLYGNCMATQRQGNGDRPRGGPRNMLRDFFRNPTRTASRSIMSCRAASGLGRSGSFRPTWSCAVSFRGRGSGARQLVGSQQTRAPDPRPATPHVQFRALPSIIGQRSIRSIRWNCSR
jgi:hypothetical protein